MAADRWLCSNMAFGSALPTHARECRMASDDNPTLKYASKALERITQLALSATPKAFEVCYHYASGEVPRLNQVIDAALGSGKAIDDELIEDIHEQFFGNQRMMAAVGNATQLVEQTIGSVAQTLDGAKDDIASYGGSLSSFSAAVANQPTAELRECAKSMLAETKRMVEKNASLHERFSAAANEIQRLQTDLEEVRRDALTDDLTGLANRRAFDLALKQQTVHSTETGEPFCLLLLDIDHFKRFNDTYGHQLGDGVLRLVGRTLHESVKGRDRPARYGGEEFAIILRPAALAGAMALADQVRLAIAEKRVVRRATAEGLGRITVSIGCAQYRPGEPPRDLIRRADLALYAAKHGGRNCVMAETDELQRAAG